MSSVTPRLLAVPSGGAPKIFNITNFSGINTAENPFSTSSTSAKDSLNLYINDEGTLATRPRLHLDSLYSELDVSEILSAVKYNEDYHIILYLTEENSNPLLS